MDPNVTKDEDSVAEFRCEVEANPFDAKTVKWKLPHRSSYAPGRNWRDRSQIIGKKHALKKYDQFAFKEFVQFHEIFVTKIINKFIYLCLLLKK